jgi:hypothetical protein
MRFTGFVSVLLLHVLTSLPSSVVEARHAFAVQDGVMAGDASESRSIWLDQSTVRFRRGDDPRWADPRFDDSDWEQRSVSDLPARTGVYWVRSTIRPTGPDNVFVGSAETRGHSLGDFLRSQWKARIAQDGIAIMLTAAYELYIDGRLVGRNGVVGTDWEQEFPGSVRAVFHIPSDLLTGEPRVLAVRVSAWRSGFPSDRLDVNVGLGNFRNILEWQGKQATLSLVALGGALVMALVYGLVWLLAQRERATALFSILCVGAAVMQAVQVTRSFSDYPYDWHYPRVFAITIISVLLGLLLVAFAVRVLRAPRGAWILLTAGATMAVVWRLQPNFSDKAEGLSWCALGFALLVASWGARQRSRGAWFLLAGCALGMLTLTFDSWDFVEQSFVFGFGPPMLGGLAALTLGMRDAGRAARQTALTSQRLEIELLKKNIQPHFLLNTLTVLIEVIEQAPATAVKLIEALTEEFQILAQVASEKLIPLGQELDLCRSHLRIMSVRRGASCELSVTGADDRALVPPALFHTLVENGLTHEAGVGDMTFVLHAEYRPNWARYTFTAPRADWKMESWTDATGAGTGLRYVKARLDESFPGCWTLTAGPVAGGWQTVIEVRGM